MITVTLYSNPLSSVAVAEYPPYLGACALLSVCISEGTENVGAFVQGIVSALERAQLCFSTC